MRIYGSVQVCFWENMETQKLSDQAKLLAIYLLTGPHSNMLGCFRLPDGYITEDLNWNIQTVRDAFQELIEIKFLTRDEQSSWLVIHNFLQSNPVQNPRQGVGIKKLFYLVPKYSNVYKPLIKSLLTHGKYLEEEFIEQAKHSLTVFEDCITDKDQEQNQNKEQNQEVCMSGKPDVALFNDLSFEKPKNQQTEFKAQAIEVLNFLNEKTGRAYRPVDSNLKLITARLKTGATVMDCRQIIAKKTREWKGNHKMEEYLRPETLFNAIKFEQYIGELVIPQGAENDCEHP